MTVSGKTAIKARLNRTNAIVDQTIDNVADTFAHEVFEVTIGAEDTNVIELTLQVAEPDGTNVAAARSFWLRWHEATGIEAVAAAITNAATTGTEVSTTANAASLITTNASGVAVIDVTDIGGASGKTFYGLLIPVSALGRAQSITITFD